MLVKLKHRLDDESHVELEEEIQPDIWDIQKREIEETAAAMTYFVHCTIKAINKLADEEAKKKEHDVDP